MNKCQKIKPTSPNFNLKNHDFCCIIPYMSLEDDIKKKAIELGFDLVGITDASSIDARQVELFTAWLNSGFAGQMNYMHKNLNRRFNPAEFLDNARSIIVVGLNYKTPKQKLTPLLQKNPTGKIVSYAQYEDYHPFIEKLLHELIDFIETKTAQEIRYKICIDSSPLAERALAVRAGLGFVGKNHMLINPKLGCQIFLGEIITSLKLLPDKPVSKDCADCNKCIEVCPTEALRTDGQFDANKCINYLSIEYKGDITPELSKKIDNCLFGCEECIITCPYHKSAPPCQNKKFKFYPDRTEYILKEILNLTTETFENKFCDSVINRLGLERLKRNALICLANVDPTGDKKTG
jgi:epoxyqueuosine reductase